MGWHRAGSRLERSTYKTLSNPYLAPAASCEVHVQCEWTVTTSWATFRISIKRKRSDFYVSQSRLRFLNVQRVRNNLISSCWHRWNCKSKVRYILLILHSFVLSASCGYIHALFFSFALPSKCIQAQYTFGLIIIFSVLANYFTLFAQL